MFGVGCVFGGMGICFVFGVECFNGVNFCVYCLCD